MRNEEMTIMKKRWLDIKQAVRELMIESKNKTETAHGSA
jgi:hypothetical protein